MQLPLYPLIRFYFRSTGTRNLKRASAVLCCTSETVDHKKLEGESKELASCMVTEISEKRRKDVGTTSLESTGGGLGDVFEGESLADSDSDTENYKRRAKSPTIKVGLQIWSC